MSKTISSVSTSDTFQVWLQRTNDLVSELGTSIVTASVSGDVTIGNAVLKGAFAANNISIDSTLRVNTIDTKLGNTSPIEIKSQSYHTSTSTTPIVVKNSSGPKISIQNNNITWLAGLRGSAGTGTDAQFVIGVNGSSTYAIRVGTDGTVYANTVVLDSLSSSTTSAVRSDRTISTNNGITGGGNLTANRTLGLTGMALAFHNLSTNGIVAKNGSGLATTRTLTPGTGITISNGDGVSGNPTVALTGQASAFHNLSANGIVTKTSTGTATVRTLTQGTGIIVTNGNGVSGNPTISADASSSTAASKIVIRDSYGSFSSNNITGSTLTTNNLACTTTGTANIFTGSTQNNLIINNTVADAELRGGRITLGSSSASIIRSQGEYYGTYFKVGPNYSGSLLLYDEGIYSTNLFQVQTIDGIKLITNRSDGAPGIYVNPNGRLGIGTASPTVFVDAYINVADGPSGGTNRITSNDMGTGHTVDFIARGLVSSANGRTAKIGVYRNTNTALNPVGYVSMEQEASATETYLWFDNSAKLKTTTTKSVVGTDGGSFVGDQQSDERLKEIEPTFPYGLDTIKDLTPIRFNFIGSTEAKLGFGAQSTVNVVPESVYDTQECIDGYTTDEETGIQTPNSDQTTLAMDYTQIIPVLVSAIQEMAAKIEVLESKLAAK